MFHINNSKTTSSAYAHYNNSIVHRMIDNECRLYLYDDCIIELFIYNEERMKEIFTDCNSSVTHISHCHAARKMSSEMIIVLAL